MAFISGRASIHTCSTFNFHQNMNFLDPKLLAIKLRMIVHKKLKSSSLESCEKLHVIGLCVHKQSSFAIKVIEQTLEIYFILRHRFVGKEE
jgi:hypothetical protein